MAAPDGLQQYVKLENRLVLLAWLNSLFGYKRNKHLLADTKGAAEGFDALGRSFSHHHLIGRGSEVKIPILDLECYDDNIPQEFFPDCMQRTGRPGEEG